jgi:hypothetical protein
MRPGKSEKAKTNERKIKPMKYNSLRIFTTVLSVLACLAFSPHINAAPEVAPPPDGCYPGFTTAEGCQALQSLTTGSGNTGVGWRSLFAVGAGSFNTGVGAGALVLNTNDNNTAVGAVALLLNTTGSDNTAVGTAALEFNDVGTQNTAVGTFALANNTVDGNTATGAFALFANTTGGTLETVSGFDLGPNTAIGSHALEMNVDGSANTAVGYNALHSQVHGLVSLMLPQVAGNTAVGFEALVNVTGSAAGNDALNTALGYQALSDLTDGNVNTAVGAQAGHGLTTGNSNVNVGYRAGEGNVTGSGNIFIGNFEGPVLPGELFHTYIDNISSTSVSGGGTDTVTINLTTGLLGHLTSSRRYKEDIKPMDKSSEALYRFKPVTYRYKKEIDKTQNLAFGLIAEEVAEVNPDLVAHNAEGRPESVHYEMVNAMLLNEFLKEHKKVEELQATVAQQQKGMEVLTAQLKEQAAQIQKVSAQLEVNTTAPRTVANK